jgi:hypothetical protein
MIQLFYYFVFIAVQKIVQMVYDFSPTKDGSQNVFKSVAQTSSKFFGIILICQKWLDSNPPNYDNHSVVLLLCFYHGTIFLPKVNDFSLTKDVFKSIAQNSNKFLLISLGVQSS